MHTPTDFGRRPKPLSHIPVAQHPLPNLNKEPNMSEDQTSEAVPADVNIDAVAATDGGYTLFVADIDDTEAAWTAYEYLKSIEDGRTLEIESVVVVKRGEDGKLEVQKATDHSTGHGLAWGVVGGVVLGVIFPPSIIASAVALGAAGAGAGKLRQLHHRSELADELQDTIAPGHSGIVALVSDPGVVKIRKALDKANRVVESAVDDVVAKEIKAAAKEADEQAKTDDA